MGRVNNFLNALQNMASDNSNVYRKYPNNMGPNGWDCCTYISKALYDCGIASGEWHDQGYFWPHISEDGFDWFLLNVCGMEKSIYWGRENLVPGDILISRESYGHTVAFAGGYKMWEGNPNYPDDKSIGLHDWAEMDWMYVYRLPNEYDDPTKDDDEGDRELTNIEKRLLEIWMWTDTCRQGAKNDYVEVVQQYLADKGYYAGTVDKEFGPVTEEALKSWQKDNNLLSDGVVNADDWAIIRKG